MKTHFILLVSMACLVHSVKAQIGGVGINVGTPRAMLHVGDSSVLFNGPAELSSNAGPTPWNGLGNRMMWYADKAAFRSGGVSGGNWDRDSIGIYSFATGWDTKAKGLISIAFGHSTSALGDFSFAAGYNTKATGAYATCFGSYGAATHSNAFASGDNTLASGFASTAIGSGTQASEYGTLSGGWNTEATADEAVALNTGTKANGYSSTSLGLGTIANGTATLAIGTNNDPLVGPGGYYTFFPEQPLFIIGNGAGNSQRQNAMVVRFDGRTGIGINTPDCRLAVHEPASNWRIAKFSNGGGYGEIIVANDVHQVDLGAWDTHGYVGTKDYAAFVLRTGGTGRVFIHPSGDVGIAKQDPTRRLDVVDPDTSVQVARFTSGGGYGEVVVGNSTDQVDIGVNQYYGYMGTKQSQDLVLRTGTFPGLLIKYSNDHVGIGHFNPEHRLHVKVPYGNAIISKFESSGGYGEINVDNGEGNVDFGVAGTSGYIGTKHEGNFYFRTNGWARVVIMDSTGYVGINTPTPSATLEVNGTAMKPGGGTWGATSDARLKENIAPYKDGLNAVLAINPVTYQYNSKSGYETNQAHIGVIAQELEPVAPYMVSVSDKVLEDGTAGYLEVDNSAMIYMLINAVKEQQVLINQLQEKISSIETVANK